MRMQVSISLINGRYYVYIPDAVAQKLSLKPDQRVDLMVVGNHGLAISCLAYADFMKEQHEST